MDIEQQLGYPRSIVAGVICARRKKLQAQQSKETEVQLSDPVEEENIQEEKPEKRAWCNTGELVFERADNGRDIMISKRKPTPKDKEPVKVCMKNCIVCRFSSPGGYCDYMTITGESRKDKTGICTHRELRK